MEGLDRAGTLRGGALFFLNGAEPTMMRGSGASVVFGDFAGFVFGPPGTLLASTRSGGP